MFLCLALPLFCLSSAFAKSESKSYTLQAWVISHDEHGPEAAERSLERVTTENPIDALLGKREAMVETLIELVLIEGEVAEYSREHLVHPIGRFQGKTIEDQKITVGDRLAAKLTRIGDRFQLGGLQFSSSRTDQWLVFGEGSSLWVPSRAIMSTDSRITLKVGQSLVMSGLSEEGKARVLVFRLLASRR